MRRTHLGAITLLLSYRSQWNWNYQFFH